MELRLIRLPEVISKTGRSRPSIYKGIQEGTFPKPHKIGPRAIAWTVSSIDEWIKEKLNNPGTKASKVIHRRSK